ncbi:MAG: L-threonine 3-dehydrogenase [Bacteroidales bacterium]|jgi:threonine 3-dehydrogenase|nr:L-threonine 3-dehydrogenase [Bacteroidales bacterium]
MKRILVTGALGQIGSELTDALRDKYGKDNVVASDLQEPCAETKAAGPCEIIDVLDKNALDAVVKHYKVDTIYHLGAILSAVGEKNPQLAYQVNMNGLFNVLEVAREQKLERVLVPSSIAAFGPDSPKNNTPNDTIQRPTSMYGVTKVAGELLGNYYVKRFGVDVRGVRYPGIISYKTLPGGGTTDYAIDIFYEALKNKKYTSFLGPDSRLPMMFMSDAIKSIMDLAEAPFESLKHHADYNVAAVSFTPQELADAIKKRIPEFEISYEPDYRQEIADSWPASLDDSCAREEWGWSHEYGLEEMVDIMLEKIQEKLS